MTAGAEEPSALIQLERPGGRSDPNLRATEIELYDGLTAESQNRWPSLGFDVGAASDLLSPFLPAGFYYKTFLWPASWWSKVYEPLIRRAAGLGRAPTRPDPDFYLHRHAHCDVLVVGAGPAGLTAALAAGRAGARVILVEREAELGGSLLGESGSLADFDGREGDAWLQAVAAELAALPEVTVLRRTNAFGYLDHNYLVLHERVTDHLPLPPADQPRQRLWRVRAKQVVLCTGAIERPLVFHGNDRPGVMLAGAARTYLNRFAVRPGSRVVVFTNNDSAYAAALDLARADVAVEAIVDLRARPDGPLPAAAAEAGLPIRRSSAVVGTEGRLRVGRAWVSPMLADGSRAPGEPHALRCDCLLVSGGWNPTVHLFSQSRGRLRFDDAAAAFVPDRSFQPERSAGAARGSMMLAECMAEGGRAGAEAARDAGFAASAPETPAVREPTQAPLLPTWAVPSHVAPARAKAFVDFQNDVTAKDLGLAVREGFQSIEHVKRYTTTGMGTDQGKTSNVNALAIVADKRGIPIEAVGTTTFRMPYTPVTFGALAGPHGGELFDPIRRTPSHDWATAHGAVFEDVGNWKRARYFPRPGEDMHAAVQRECRAVREGVGLFDASTLGKIDLQGADSAQFLNRVYSNAWIKLETGRCRYGLMLRDDGMVFDDGVTARLGPGHFHMTTTTGGAARVLAWLEEWLQTEWPQLEVYCTSVTEQWAAIAVVGPRARDVLRAAGTDLDLGQRIPAAPRVQGGAGRRSIGPGVPHQLFRRDRLRDQRSLGLRPSLVGGAVGGGPGPRHHRLRHREHARAAGGEGLHHRRAGHGRHGHALRSRDGLDRLQGEARLHRQARAAPVRRRGRRPQAAGRPPDRRAGRGAGGGGPDRGVRAVRGAAGADDRPCHLQLSQPQSRPLDRHGAGPRRARDARSDRPCAHARPGDRGQGGQARVHRSGRDPPRWLSRSEAARWPDWPWPSVRSRERSRSTSQPCRSGAS